MTACPQFALDATIRSRVEGRRFVATYGTLLAESGHCHGEVQHPQRSDDDPNTTRHGR